MADPTRRRIFISTGEVSGDLQGAFLIEALMQQARDRHLTLDITALGGPRMAKAGATLVGETTSIGSVGIFEALPYLMPTLRLQRVAKTALDAQPPDIAVLIDYMNPNLVMGNYIKTHHPQVPVIYYIAPQQWVWAFSEKDTRNLVQCSDRMLAIFKAEADYYQGFGAATTWVGHPLVDRYPGPADQAAARQQLDLPLDTPVVTLLPASRQQEVKYLMPVLLKAAQIIQAQCPEVTFLLPVSIPALQASFEQGLAAHGLNGRVIGEGSQGAIAAADVAITKSGTANLEIALMDVPQVVAYRIHPLSARIAHYLLKFDVPYVSPVNLVVNQPIVPEFLQWQATPEAIAAAALELLHSETARQTMRVGYAKMREALGPPGVCQRTADLILDALPEMS
ncbi:MULTISPECIES: lipid-A-disaccharide synthase [Cyanophyceae]|uniref:lipid-A-disaccharide synthase n=1 Tax=Cyanophyceae TaxID=3028117 RepID=UPI001684D889|nr:MULTISPECIES: lipid-A-disaccharide synthase [Cyanophyceae]MBD1916583.1 lipid-A-disaccharide synthase [Phormidium sp. FACHB-77]MBD2032150.1 lipid-A-disaccharide synthase [Phormidium sp. FACHB-322]MBD2053030.1 lipid-A-disaccharide synthase [Leptolyngbya sp. FACHB-60]